MPVEPFPFVPYCGSAPVPGQLSAAWNLDPPLLGAFALAAVGLAWVSRRSTEPMAPRRTLGFAVAWLVLLVAFVSPLCNLTSALFSARVVQHLLTIQVAAPLLVLAWPADAPRWPGWARSVARPFAVPELAWGLFGVTLWVWHLPGPYMAALRSDAVLWLMHATLFAGALAAWRSVLVTDDSSLRARGLLSALGTSVHLAMLAALLIFAPEPLFAYHATTTLAWGLSPLADQQLGGLVMGVVGSLAYVALNLYAAGRWMASMQRRVG